VSIGSGAHTTICHLAPRTVQSAAAPALLVLRTSATQSRIGGLDYVVKTGIIVEAVENQPWSGEANVHVSIANWVKIAYTDENKERAVNEGHDPLTQPPISNPIKLSSPPEKLWHKVDPKLAILIKGKNLAHCNDHGQIGKKLSLQSYELDFRETLLSTPPYPTAQTLEAPFHCPATPT